MHSAAQQQQRRGNSTRMPLMYLPNPTSLPPAPLLQAPPLPLRYGGIGSYQPPASGGSGGMKHHPRGGGNRGGRGSLVAHRQQRPAPGSRYHPYQFRQPLPPQQQQQRPYRPAQPTPRTPAALMGTPPGMTQSEYEPIHSAQVKRDKEKLVRLGNVLAPSNTTQFLIRDHNRQTPSSSSTATPTPTHQSAGTSDDSSSSVSQQQPASLTYDQMFEMNDADAQSDDTGSGPDGGLGERSFDDDFNDIYYQCRYERYASFSRTALVQEVMSLCSNIDRLQHEKSEVEKRLRDVQQHLYVLTTSSNVCTSNDSQEPAATTEEVTTPNIENEDDSRIELPLLQEQQKENDSIGGGDEGMTLDDDPLRLQISHAQTVATEPTDTIQPPIISAPSGNGEAEQKNVLG